VRGLIPLACAMLAAAPALAQPPRPSNPATTTPTPAPAPAARAPSAPVVAEVKVVGGTTITPETVEYYLGISKGDRWDPEIVRKNFHRFWDSGLVEDLRVDVEDIAPGKVRVIVTVRERPKVTEFKFQGNKKLGNSSLREKIETAGLSLRGDVPLRTADVQRLRQAILDAYAKEGYSSAVVTPELKDVGKNEREVIFHIDEGGKVRIGEIRFEGNHVFSDRRLRMALKKEKERRWYRPWGKKTIWSKESWGEDSENLKKFYMNRGYKDVVVGEPKVTLVARHPDAATQKGKKYRTVVTIPVDEGRRFALGTLTLEGNTVLPSTRLRRLFYEVKSGKTYDYSKIEEGNDAIRNIYQSMGYIYAYTNQQLKNDPKDPKVVNVTVQIFEGDRYRLGRLEFAGNTKTQEKVLRREFRLDEGDWMDMAKFRRSVFKVNQLGYFKLTEDPLKFDFDEENRRVNVTVQGQEVGRTDIQFGAGYSELDHFFVQFTFNTRNFLGRGESLGLAISTGARAENYSLSFSEPYFQDRRQVIGGSIYKQSYNLVDLNQHTKGASVFWGFNTGDFGQAVLTYTYQDVLASYVAVRQGTAGQPPLTPHERPFPPPYVNMATPAQFFSTYSGVTSAIIPSYAYDSRDDPFDPSRGVSTYMRLGYVGGPLGGGFNYFQPQVGFSIFHPLTRRFILAGNIEGGIIKPFSGSTIPVFNRYRMGGENSLRGLPYLEVLPRKANGDYFTDAYGARLGGDRYLQTNLEYQIKVGGPVKLILFSDIGNTWFETQGWDLSLLRYTAGAEIRIFLPVFQAPLRFIYGINLKPYSDEKRSDFQFSIGTTF
jgi:outer membrane protein insertion porin family